MKSVKLLSRTLWGLRRRWAPLLAALAFLWFQFLLITHIVLWTHLDTRLLNKIDYISMSHGFAVSPWPGCFFVKDLRIALHGRSIQAEISHDYVQGCMDILPLLSRTVSLDTLQGRGMAIKFRLVRPPNALSDRELQQLPDILGVETPYEKHGPANQDVTQLWSLTIEDVSTDFDLFWIEGFRVTGKGGVKVGLTYKPRQGLEVDHLQMRLAKGQVHVGAEKTISKVHMKLRAQSEELPLDGSFSLDAVEQISIKVRGEASTTSAVLKPHFVDLPVRPRSGEGKATFDLDMRKGVLTPASSLRYRASKAGASTKELTATGDLTFSLDGKQKQIVLRSDFRDVSVQHAEAKPAQASPKVGLVSLKVTTANAPPQWLSGLRAEARTRKATIPDLAWLNTVVKSKSFRFQQGRASSNSTVNYLGGGRVSGGATTRLREAWIDSSMGGAKFNSETTVRWHYSAIAKRGAIDQLEMRAEPLHLQWRDAPFVPWPMRISARDVVLQGFPPDRADGNVSLRAASIKSLLPWFIGPQPLRGITSAALNLEGVTAGSFRVFGAVTRPKVVVKQLTDGGFSLKGTMDWTGGELAGQLHAEAGPFSKTIQLGDTKAETD